MNDETERLREAVQVACTALETIEGQDIRAEGHHEAVEQQAALRWIAHAALKRIRLLMNDGVGDGSDLSQKRNT